MPGLPDHAVEFLLHQRVQAAGGLVQDQQFRLVHKRLHQAEFLLVALGELAGMPVQVQAQAFRERIDPAGRDRPADGLVMRQQCPAVTLPSRNSSPGR